MCRHKIWSQQHLAPLMCSETRQLCFPGGPAAALQSAAGFAAFSFVMDKFQVAQEAEAAAHPGHTAQVCANRTNIHGTSIITCCKLGMPSGQGSEWALSAHGYTCGLLQTSCSYCIWHMTVHILLFCKRINRSGGVALAPAARAGATCRRQPGKCTLRSSCCWRRVPQQTLPFSRWEPASR